MKTKFLDNIKYNHKYKGLRPFTHSRKGWKEDVTTEKIKYENAVGGVLFDEKLLALEGNELPELFVIWKIVFIHESYLEPSIIVMGFKDKNPHSHLSKRSLQLWTIH
jgi:hypothetical protein